MLALPYYEEVWRDIKGYEGLYQVSNFGRVKSLERFVKYWRGGMLLRKSQTIKLNYDSDGYCIVGLSKDGTTLTKKVHRLVAMTFPDLVDWTEEAKDKPFDEIVVNHKDENKVNNWVNNLEWCTVKYNNIYGNRLNNVSKHRINNPLICKPVKQYTLDMEFIAEYPSAAEAERQTGIKHSSISKCCRGYDINYYTKNKCNYKQTGGYIWRYV